MEIEITVEIILAVVTAVITAFLGWAAKKWNWDTADYIPFQNLAVAIISGILFIATGLVSNVIIAFIISFGASFGAGGLYDLIKTKKEE
ncbi:MAG: hypothetical protein ACLR6T_06405 [Intestinibacter sp.]